MTITYMNWSFRYLMNQKHFTNTLVTMLIHGRKLSAKEMQPETLPHSHFWWCDNSSILNGFKMFVCFIVFVLFWFVLFFNFFFEGGGGYSQDVIYLKLWKRETVFPYDSYCDYCIKTLFYYWGRDNMYLKK